MVKTTIKISGMMCSMCEAHINDAIRREFAVKKVTSSHKKGEAVILSDVAPDSEKIEKIIADTGYQFISIKSEPVENKGLFSKLFK